MISSKLVSIISEIEPNQLESYLASGEWVNEKVPDLSANIWHRSESQKASWEIIQPLTKDTLGYKQRIVEAVRVLAKFEDRSVDDVVRAIGNFDNTMVRVRVIASDVDHGSIPINDGVLLFQRAKDLIVSTVLSTFNKRRIFAGSWPDEVKAFLQTVKLGQTEAGSYVVNVIAPAVSLSQDSELYSDVSTGELVSQNLARSLGALTTAIATYHETSTFNAFENAVERGVSANLCDALIGISGSGRNRDIEISLTTRGRSDDLGADTPFKLKAADIPTLQVAADYYKGSFIIQNYELSGLVVRLDHEPNEEYGSVKVAGDIQGIERNVSIQLKLSYYWEALRAHRPKIPVRCYGDLHVTARSARLINPHDFQVMDRGELFHGHEK